MMPPERLSAQDSTFLYVESADAPMHMGMFGVLDPLDLTGTDITTHFEQKVAGIPRLRKRVVGVPGGLARPVLIDDAAFDIRRHVHVVANPVPYDRRRALRFAEELMSRPMPRDRPLWGAWLFEMAEGRTGAILLIHHCLADGIAGLGLAAQFLSLSPDAAPPATPPGAEPHPAPGAVGLVRDAVTDVAGDALRMTRRTAGGLRRLARDGALSPSAVGRTVGQVDLLGALTSLRGGGGAQRQTSLATKVGGSRRFLTAQLSLADVKRIKAHHGCTVNDVILSCVAGGLRPVLAHHGDVLDEAVIKASVPVNVRTPEGSPAVNNAVSTIVVDLPVDIEDPVDRLRETAGRMTALKGSGQIPGYAQLMALADLAPPLVLQAVSRAAASGPPADILVTNMPGPPMALYLMGSLVREIVPLAPIAGTTSMSVAVLSYQDSLFIGVGTDPRVVASLEMFLEGLTADAAALLETAA